MSATMDIRNEIAACEATVEKYENDIKETKEKIAEQNKRIKRLKKLEEQLVAMFCSAEGTPEDVA